ncbi:MFS transporter [Nakamurella lactea]|uniref:MFS transporter n=1 Tax=Nakamurella lactea TaxID=459515 RepID=UPI0003FAE080|nr:MFS transporter [Nakamurella lactea]
MTRQRQRPLGANFWRLWSSSGLSNLADGIFQVALPLIAIRYTQSPTAIAGLSFALALPWLLFALQAGALADRVDRRKIMFWSNTARALVLVALVPAVATGAAAIWLLYAAALLLGTSETLYDTSAQSILPQLVDRDQLSRANSRLYAAELTANQFVGPPLGGLLVAAGLVLAVATPAGLWFAAVALLLLLRGSFRVERIGRTTLRADIAEGLRFLWHNRVLRSLAVLTGLFNLATNATFAVLVLHLVGPSSAAGLSDAGYGILLTALAVGSLLGSFVAPWVERRLGRSLSLALSMIGGAVMVGVPAATADPYLIGAGFVVGGVTTVIWNVIAVSLRQRIAPDRLLGRVNSGYRLVAWGTRPLGAAVGGALGQLFGLRLVFGVAAMLMLAMLMGMTGLTNSALDAAERTGDPADDTDNG